MTSKTILQVAPIQIHTLTEHPYFKVLLMNLLRKLHIPDTYLKSMFYKKHTILLSKA